MYLHGSGWVLNEFDVEEEICAEIANRAKCIVVSVDYRLAPEHKFPVPLEDCYAATLWVSNEKNAASIRADPKSLMVCGDSAGANLAAAVALLSKKRTRPKLKGQVLIVPPTNCSANTTSYRKFSAGFGNDRQVMRWLWKQYLRDRKDGSNPLASPLRAKDLSSLPPALVITAEYDPLRDEGEAYAARLRKAGIPVRMTRYKGMIHAFPLMRGTIKQEAMVIKEIAEWIHAGFAKKP